jgi:hypothetical protein
MSVFPQFFNGDLPTVFNPQDFYVTQYIDNLQTNQTTSNVIASSALKVINENGDHMDVATQQELDDGLNNLKNEILGGASGAFDTLKEIQDALVNDPNIYTTLVTQIATKANQTDLDSTNNNVNNLQTKTTNQSFSSGTTTFTGTVSGITKSMVSLGNCDNTSDLNKPISTATQTALDLKANLSSPTFTGTVSGITKSMISLGNCDNTSDLNKPISTATQTALDLKANLSSPTFTGTVSGITKSMVSLGNCDNTSDLNKPISTTTQTALNLKANQSSLDTTNSNVTTLQNKTNALSYNSGTNTTTLNSKLSVALDESINGNLTIGDASTDTLTVNANTTFVNNVSGLTKSMVSLGNCDNTSDLNKPISTATQTALDLKANDNVVVKLSGNQTIAGIKTYSSSPIVPTCSANDNSTKVASTSYVDTMIANLVDSSPSTLNTLNELATALGDDANFSTTMTNSLAGKASLTSDNTFSGNQTYNTGTITFNNGLSSNAITLGGNNLDTRITNIENKTSKVSYDSGTDTLTIASKMSITKDVSDNGSINLGDGINSDIVYLKANINSNSQTITPTQMGYLSGASSNLQTQLNAKANLASPTFTGTVSGITKSMVSLGNCDNTSDANKPVSTAQQTALDLKANLSSPTFTGTVSGITKSMISLGNCDNTSDLNKPISTVTQTALDLKADLSSPTLTGTPLCPTASTATNTTQIASTAYVQSNLSNYLTTSSASSTYAGLSSSNTLSGTNTVSMINEQINNVTGVTTSLSLNYSSIKGINYINTPTSNFSLAITNVPTGSTTATYTVTLLMSVKYYCNSITVNGTSRTIYAGNGTSNISINASASYVMQQLSIVFLNSSTPIVFSNVISIW